MEFKEKIKKETEILRKEIRQRTLTYIAGGLGFVAGLAWNEAIRTLIDSLFPSFSSNIIIVKFLYAIFVTLIVVLVLRYIEKFSNKD